MSSDPAGGARWPTVGELRNASTSRLLEPIRAAVQGAITRLHQEVDEQSAMLQVMAVVAPADWHAAAAEVERRWELHRTRLAESPYVHAVSKVIVIESVYRDVAAGWL